MKTWILGKASQLNLNTASRIALMINGHTQTAITTCPAGIHTNPPGASQGMLIISKIIEPIFGYFFMRTLPLKKWATLGTKQWKISKLEKMDPSLLQRSCVRQSA